MTHELIVLLSELSGIPADQIDGWSHVTLDRPVYSIIREEWLHPPHVYSWRCIDVLFFRPDLQPEIDLFTKQPIPFRRRAYPTIDQQERLEAAYQRLMGAAERGAQG